MKTKTFFISYFLFLIVMFSSFSIISIFLTNSQIDSLRNNFLSEYTRIADSLKRDINALYSRGEARIFINSFIKNVIRTHEVRGILLNFNFDDQILDDANITFDGYTFQIRRTIFTDFDYFSLTAYLGSYDYVLEVRSIHRVLLFLFISFSVIFSIILNSVLTKIFNDEHSKNMKIKIRELEEESERKQRFIDNIAHEIRTPITSIHGYAQYLQNAKYSEEDVFESLNYIISESSHMQKLTNSMLELAQIKNFNLSKKEVSIKELFDSVCATIPNKINVYGDGVIEGSSELLKSLIINLCTNSINAGASKILIKFENNNLTVEDNGCGIPEEAIKKVLEPFYKLNEGTGLGLSICKQIADIHNASINIKSEVDVGTTVTINF